MYMLIVMHKLFIDRQVGFAVPDIRLGYSLID